MYQIRTKIDVKIIIIIYYSTNLIIVICWINLKLLFLKLAIKNITFQIFYIGFSFRWRVWETLGQVDCSPCWDSEISFLVKPELYFFRLVNETSPSPWTWIPEVQRPVNTPNLCNSIPQMIFPSCDFWLFLITLVSHIIANICW